MADCESDNESNWIKNVKLGGAIPHLEADNCQNGWATPSGDIFNVRGPNYFSTKVKIPGGEYLLKPLGFDWIKSTTKICEILKNPNSRVRKALDKEWAKGNKPFVWAFNLQLPSRDNYSAVAYYVALDPIEVGSLMDQFLKGDDAFRKSRLKLIANIVTGPWIVRTAVGEQAICILGRAVSCNYITGNNFIEIDIDIGASMVANAIVHLALGYITTLTVDLAFLIESQTDLELPERILGAIRFSELNQASAGLYEFPPEGNTGDIHSSFPGRLWKSFGQILHPGSQGELSSSSTDLNGEVDDEEEFHDAK